MFNSYINAETFFPTLQFLSLMKSFVCKMVKINCTKTLENCEWILKKIGIWPASKFTKRRITKLILNWFLYISVFLILIFDIKIAIESANYNLLNTMTCILMPLVNLTAKSSTLLINGREFCLLLKDLESIFFNKHTDKLNKHIQLINKISNILLKYFTIALSTYIIIGIIVPLTKNRETIIPVPFDTGKFDAIYKCYFLFTSVYMAFESIGLDVMYMTLLSLGCAQLNILQYQLTNVAKYLNLPYEYKNKMKLNVGYILNHCIALHETINQ